MFYFISSFSLLIAAFFASTIGVGGGSLFTPIQIFIGYPLHQAVTTSLFLIMMLSISATFIYRRAEKVDWAVAVLFVAFSASGGFIGGMVSERLPSYFLNIALGITLFLAGMSIFLPNRKKAIEVKSGRFIWNRKFGNVSYGVNIVIASIGSVLAGILSGMLGIGGGVVMIPFMVLVIRIPTDIAVATSVFMVGLTALGGFVGHVSSGVWDWRQGAWMFLPVILGSVTGAKFMLSIDKSKVKRIFGIVMVMMSVGMFVKVFFDA